MSQKYEKLKTLLRELFQLDQPDLDFGLYRIMNAKSTEVSRFLDEDLLPQVRAAFELYRSADKEELKKELSRVVVGVEGAGLNPDDSPKVRSLRSRLESEAVDIAALESDVYDYLFSFFRRYYSEGDFLAKRVYKPGVYAIPYEGEEVTLHWANKDQYYVKTSDYLRDYSFRARPDDNRTPMRVHFRLVDVAEGEHGNIKKTEGKGRVFVLTAPGESGHDFIAEEDGGQGKELVVRFEYRPATLTDWPEDERGGKKKPPVQKDLTGLTAKRVLAVALTPWVVELAKPHVMASGDQADYSRLEAHLRRYTSRNTFDYFIHKDLETFLRRELDFYIKNEVLHLDDVQNESGPRVEQYLSMIRIIRKIAGKVIGFLAQIEDFQKKLWLKKKFVVDTHYCIRVGTIPETFYPEIAANAAQRKEWAELFSIDEIEGDLLTTSDYVPPVNAEFLKRHPTLLMDTRHYDSAFTSELLNAINEIDEATDGVLIHGENCQAMRLAARRFAARIECAYIDPPYNTGNDGFMYRDNYRDSSWLAFVDGRLQALLPLAGNDSALFVSIDDNEVGNLVNLVKGHSSSAELVTLITAQLNPRGRTLDKYLAKTHEYIGAFALFGSTGAIREVTKGEAARAEYRERDEQGSFRLLELRNRNPVFNRANRPNLYFPFFSGPEGGSVTLVADSTHAIEILPRNSAGEDGCWTWGKAKAEAQRGELVARRARTGAWRVFRKDRLHGEGGTIATTKAKSVWTDKEINNENGKEVVGHLFGKAVFDFPKPVALVERCAEIGMGIGDGLFMDFFAGSGTSGHAILNLNRRDGGRRRFILVEMGDYFDTVLVPRIKKVTFTPDWKDGRPRRLATSKEAESSPRIVKVVRLESYEDALNNLEIRRTEQQQLALDTAAAQGTDGLREQYILRYMINVETRGSQSLLNAQAFTDPTAYKLRVKRPGSDESREVDVDLLETFNWLIGLRVRHMAVPRAFVAAFERDDEKRLCLKGRLRQDADGPYWFRTVDGATSDGRRTLVIWRKLTGEPERDNLVLEEWFTRQGYSAKDSEFDLIYVNGGNNLENLKTTEDLWKVRLIEEDFHRLMFEMEGV